MALEQALTAEFALRLLESLLTSPPIKLSLNGGGISGPLEMTFFPGIMIPRSDVHRLIVLISGLSDTPESPPLTIPDTTTPTPTSTPTTPPTGVTSPASGT